MRRRHPSKEPIMSNIKTGGPATPVPMFSIEHAKYEVQQQGARQAASQPERCRLSSGTKTTQSFAPNDVTKWPTPLLQSKEPIMKCHRCGKENPAQVHTCSFLALLLADELYRHGETKTPRTVADELVRMHTELEATDRQVEILTDELTKCSKAYGGLQAEIEALRSALQALYDTAPSAECSDFHHPKKDRHEIGAPCPVLERYKDACLKARAALARAGEKT
jgi:hypothetical protein